MSLGSDLKRFLWDREPVLTQGSTQALAALIIALPKPGGVLAGVLEAVFAIVTALVVMLKVDPKRPVLLTGLGTGLGTLIATLGVQHPSSGTVSTVNGLLAVVLASLLREKVTPQPAGATRHALGQLGSGRAAASHAASGGPASGGPTLARLASDATAAATALANVAEDAKALGGEAGREVPQPRTPTEQASSTQEGPQPPT
jgi:hypothetical protein